MTEVSMWLFPIAIAAVVGLVFSFKFGLRWTWGMALQQLLILCASAAGFFFLYSPTVAGLPFPASKIASYFAWLAWVLFAAFNFGQRIVLNKIALDLSLLRIQSARSRLPLLRMVCWGPPVAYWTAITESLSSYLSGDTENGDRVLQNWRSDPRVPSQAKESLIGFSMLGRVLHYDWASIIHDFELNEALFAKQNSTIPYQMASRAYAEVGRFEESARCLEKLNASSSRISATNLDLNFLAFFALAGAIPQSELVIANCPDKKALPDYLRSYWLGRAYGVAQQPEKAIACLARAKDSTPNDLTSWNERINRQIEIQQQILNGQHDETRFPSADDALIARIETVYRRLRSSADIVRPAKSLAALNTMMVLLVVSFIATNPDDFLRYVFPPGARINFLALHKGLYDFGELSAAKLWAGEWWRMITYMFLHGNSAHLLLNIGALYIFGKTVEKVYGTAKFLGIFLLSGILSGVAQVALMPNEPAIGASGAILGIFGAAIAGIFKLKDVLPKKVRESELRWMLGVAAAQVIFDQVVNNIAAMTDPGSGARIASFAHMGGIVAGFIIGMLLPVSKIEPKSSQAASTKNLGDDSS